MLRHIEVHDLAAIMSENDQNGKLLAKSQVFQGEV